MTLDTARLRSLAEKATPTPYRTRKLSQHFAIETLSGTRVADVRYISRPDGTTSADDAAYMVASCNALPALLARVEMLETALRAFSISGPDADGIEWLHVNGGRGVQATINLTAMMKLARVAIVDAVGLRPQGPRRGDVSVSERMTSIALPGRLGSGYADYGRKSIAEMVALIRDRAALMKRDAEAILAAKDADFYVCTYRGIYAQHDRVVLQEGCKS